MNFFVPLGRVGSCLFQHSTLTSFPEKTLVLTFSTSR